MPPSWRTPDADCAWDWEINTPPGYCDIRPLPPNANGKYKWADAARTKFRYPRSDGGLQGYGCLASEENCGTITVADGYFMSQDQFIEMLPGLALIAKLVPAGTTVEGMELPHHAREIVDRVT